jgi:putative transposase
LPSMQTLKEARLNRIRKWLESRHVGQAFQPAVNWFELRPFSREDLQAVTLYRRRLPHWELVGSCYFVTFRVHKRLGPVLEDNALVSLVEEVLWFGHGERYALHCYVIMPDHVHLLLQPLHGWSLGKILQGIKGFSSRQINKKLKRKGAFWQDENFDHL